MLSGTIQTTTTSSTTTTSTSGDAGVVQNAQTSAANVSGGPQAAFISVAPRDAEAPPLLYPALPEGLGAELEFLIGQLNEQLHPCQSRRKALFDCLGLLHARQPVIESLFSSHSRAPRVIFFGKLLSRFVENLTQSLLGHTSGATPQAQSPNEALRLADLSLDEIHGLTLGLSTCAMHDAGQIFPSAEQDLRDSPYNQLVTALCAHLNGMHFPDGASDQGQVLNVQNLITRAKKANLISVSDSVRKACAAFVQVVGQWASQRSATSFDAHQLGKLATQMDALCRFNLCAAPEQKIFRDVMRWLTSKAAIATVEKAQDGVSLANFCTLIKTLVKHGWLAPSDERNDAVFLALARLISRIRPECFLERDLRAIASCAVFVRSCLLNGQSERWQQKPEFSQACARVLAVLTHPRLAQCRRDGASMSRLAEFLRALQQDQAKRGEAAQATAVPQPDLEQAARCWLQGLAREMLQDLHSSVSIEHLMATLDWIVDSGWQHSEQVAALLEVLAQAIGNTGLGEWQELSVRRVVRLLNKWHRQGILNSAVRRRGLSMLMQRDVERSGTVTSEAINAETRVLEEFLILGEGSDAQTVKPRPGDRNWMPVGSKLASVPVLKSAAAVPVKATSLPNQASIARNRAEDEKAWLPAKGVFRAKPESQGWKPIEVPSQEDDGSENAQPAASADKRNGKNGRGAAKSKPVPDRGKSARSDAGAVQESRAEASRSARPIELPGNIITARQLWFRCLKDKSRDPMQILPRLAEAFPALLSEEEPKSQRSAMALALQHEQLEVAVWLMRLPDMTTFSMSMSALIKFITSLPRGFRLEGKVRSMLRALLGIATQRGHKTNKLAVTLLLDESRVQGLKELLAECGFFTEAAENATEQASDDEFWDIARRGLERAIRAGRLDIVESLLHTPLGTRLVRMRGPLGATPIFFAVGKNGARMLRMMLAFPGVPALVAQADMLGNTPLHAALMNGSDAVVDCLLDVPEVRMSAANQIGDTKRNALIAAIEFHRTPAVLRLLSLPEIKQYVLRNETETLTFAVTRIPFGKTEATRIFDSLLLHLKKWHGLTTEQLDERLKDLCAVPSNPIEGAVSAIDAPDAHGSDEHEPG